MGSESVPEAIATRSPRRNFVAFCPKNTWIDFGVFSGFLRAVWARLSCYFLDFKVQMVQGSAELNLKGSLGLFAKQLTMRHMPKCCENLRSCCHGAIKETFEMTQSLRKSGFD